MGGLLTLLSDDAFTPRRLFITNNLGVWYDPSDFSTLFQDAAGTTPVTAVGQPIGLMLDKSGRGLHVSQSVEGSRPVLAQDSDGLYAIDTTGGKYLARSGVNWSSTDKFTLIAGARKDSDATQGCVFQFGTAATAGSFGMLCPGTNATSDVRFELTGDVGISSWRASPYEAPTKLVASCYYNLAGAARADEIVPLIDGQTPTLGGSGGATAGGGSFASNYVIYIGGAGGVRPFAGLIYGVIAVGRQLTEYELRQASIWMARKTRPISRPAALSVQRQLSANTVNVFVPARDAASSDYIKYRLYHHVAADADVWTISGIWEAQFNDFGTFQQGKRLVIEDTEMICALQENGAADFMGGRAHGDEVITATPTLTVDGGAVSLASGSHAWYYGASVVFSQTSKLYRVGSALGTALADRSLTLTFSGRDMTAQQTIAHLTSYTLSNGYLAMLPPHRYETFVNGVSENTSSAQISGSCIDNVRATPLDCSAQAAIVAGDYAQTTPRITQAAFSGTYGVGCEMEVQSVSDAVLKDVFFLQKAQYSYNKAYIGVIGSLTGNQSVTSATSWSVTTRWRFYKDA